MWQFLLKQMNQMFNYIILTAQSQNRWHLENNSCLWSTKTYLFYQKCVWFSSTRRTTRKQKPAQLFDFTGTERFLCHCSDYLAAAATLWPLGLTLSINFSLSRTHISTFVDLVCLFLFNLLLWSSNFLSLSILWIS